MIAVIVSGGKIEGVYSLFNDDVLIIDRDQAVAQGKAYIPDHHTAIHPQHIEGSEVVAAMIAFSERDSHAH